MKPRLLALRAAVVLALATPAAAPMHELAAHPRAAELLRLFADHVSAAEFEPLATTGVPLAIREDWQELLAAAAKLGTITVWVAFHGIGIENDRQVNRPGAYAEMCLAIQRVHAEPLHSTLVGVG